MSTRLKKSYKFAFRSSLLITIILALSLGLFLLYKQQLEETWFVLLVFTILVFVISFSIIQVRVEKYIYRRIKKIYDDVSLLESSSFTADPVTTDMKTLTEDIEKFAKDKKIEIETLKIREEYRKDFLGNISQT